VFKEKQMLSKTEVKNIASEVVKESVFNELEEMDEVGVKNELELSEELDSEVNFDVFEDIINPRIKKGERVTYSIAVDNVQMATGITKLCSWSEIHKTYAPQGGFVLIKPRTAKGHWIKQQGLTFGKFQGNLDDVEKETANSGFTARDFMEMQAKYDEKMERLIESTKQVTEKSANEKVDLITTLLANKPDNSSSDMFKLMLTMQTEQARIEREERNRQEDLRRQEKREENERFEKLLLTLTHKEDKVDPVAEILRLQEAEDRGYSKAMSFNELLEEKAESRAIQLAENTKEESITDKALSSILTSLPQVAGFLSNRAASHNVEAPVAQNPKSMPQTDNSNPFGMETISSESHNVDNTQNVDKLNKEKELEERQAKIQHAKKVILDLTLAEIASDLIGEVDPSLTADKVIKILSEKKIDPALVCKLFVYEDFVTIADQNNLIAMAREGGKEEALLEWLKGFYNNVQQKTTAS
jgi:hypothetical protein